MLIESLRFFWCSSFHYKLTSEMFSDYWMIQHFQGFGASSLMLILRRYFLLFITESFVSLSDGEEFNIGVWVTTKKSEEQASKVGIRIEFVCGADCSRFCIGCCTLASTSLLEWMGGDCPGAWVVLSSLSVQYKRVPPNILSLLHVS